jgi:DNA-binding NtrC family response regulator
MTEGRTILGRSAAVRRLVERIERIAPTEATVLIQGERGTGKELVAAAIHEASRRQRRPYVTLNCAALPAELLVSELFGHERGAFTGAMQRHPGLLVAADTGTVLLDEIGDLSPHGQATLLRFLQEREVRPLGTTRAIRLDVRVIAATNRDLEAAVARNEFRADLYDRLAEVVVRVPPLRERREDIAGLADHFVAVYARRHGVRVRGLTSQARRALVAYDWPGNVRELEKAISRGVIFAERGWIDADHLELPVVDVTREASSREAASDADPRLRGLTRRQREVLRLASIQGSLSRGDVMARFAISGEAVRRDFVALVRAGFLQRSGRGRGSRYVTLTHTDQPPTDAQASSRRDRCEG